MARLTGCIAAAAILGLTVTAASAQVSLRPALSTVPQYQQAKLAVGAIRGTVLDDRGAPVPDAMVTALSPLSSRLVATDARGRFRIDSLPSGVYVLRVHRTGFVSTRREGVRVAAGGGTSDVDAIRLRRDDGSESRPILAAGMDAPAGETTPGDSDNHSETAWRLRHVKRSVLKQDGEVVPASPQPDEPVPTPAGSLFGRAFDGAATRAASFLSDTPFTGEVNLLTSSAVPYGSLLPADFMPRGIAYISIGAPAASGRWDVRGSMSQSDMSAWVIAGSFTSRETSAHAYNFGVSYSAQQYQSQHTSPMLPLAAPAADTRNVGEMYGADRWTLSPLIAVEYGARYAHYDYLTDRSLFSPSVGLTVTPYSGTQVSAHVSQRMLAPGAEEFLPPATVGPWLPPERTFEPLQGEDLRAERVRTFDVGIDHDLGSACAVGVHRIEQRVADQLVALFGLPVDGGPGSPGHYFVSSAGDFDASGWAFSLSTIATQHVHGSIDYTLMRTNWLSTGDMAAIAVLAPSAVRPRTEDVHDLTTSFETEVPQTATRVFVLYKVNTAFAHAADDPSRPALDYRFDVQVNQALPFMPFSHTARWEVLVGMRNMFREPSETASVYDELLVVRPPKRVVGGFLVRF
jgi:hypothetical protein